MHFILFSIISRETSLSHMDHICKCDVERVGALPPTNLTALHCYNQFLIDFLMSVVVLLLSFLFSKMLYVICMSYPT